MKSNSKNFKISLLVIMGIVISACAPLPAGGSDSAASTTTSTPAIQLDQPNPPLPNSSVPESVIESPTQSHTNSETIKNGDTVRIPDTPEIPPEDILLQIQFDSQPDPYPDIFPTPTPCIQDCIEPQSDLVVLHHFEANQTVRVEIYQDASSEASFFALFLKEIIVQTGQEQTFEFKLENPEQYKLLFYLYDENGSTLPINCSSSEMSLFSTGQIVISGQTDGIVNSSLKEIEIGRVERIPPDTPMTIIGASVCRRGVWWPVELATGEKIWVLSSSISPAK
ncbi:MAG: hypothetical protein U0Z26_12370 [Anaerolineales bacterium]